jgi:hypothetical protein
LFEAFESPFPLFRFEWGDAQEFENRIFWVRDLELLGVVVLVLDVDISRIFIVIVFVLKVVPSTPFVSPEVGA